MSVVEIERTELEAMIVAAARWGWTQANSYFFRDFLEPRIEWDAAGRPHIVNGVDPAP